MTSRTGDVWIHRERGHVWVLLRLWDCGDDLWNALELSSGRTMSFAVRDATTMEECGYERMDAR